MNSKIYPFAQSFTLWIVVTLSIFVSTRTYADAPESWKIMSSLGTDESRQMIRYADPASLRYQEPWAIFEQHWLIFKDGKYLDPGSSDTMAINCLTGANGRSNIERRETQTAFLERVGRERDWMTSINILDPSEGLDANLIEFACHCNKPMDDELPDSEKIEAIYNSQIFHQTRVEMVEVRAVTFETQQMAHDALRVVSKDIKKMEKLYRLEGSIDTSNDGYLGWHPLASYSLTAQKVLEKLEPGQISQEIEETMYGFTVQQLIARRVNPASPIQKWRPTIENYFKYYSTCRK